MPSKLRTILLLPILAPIFMLGWVMNIVGERKKQRAIRQSPSKPARDSGVQLVMVPHAEEELVASQ